MPIIKEFNDDYDFSVTVQLKNDYVSNSYFFLDKNLAAVEKVRNNEVEETFQVAIAVTKDGLCEWDKQGVYWRPLSDKFQDAYRSWAVEKGMLTNADSKKE